MVKFAHILLILAVAGDINAQFFDFFSGFKPPTLRPIFEPSKSPRQRTYVTTERYQENGRIKNIEHTTKSIRKTTKSNKQSNKKIKIDKIIDDGRNTINYDNPRSKTYTENPFARPGVKPAVVNGPPITNKPPRPYVPRPIAGLSQTDDGGGSVTPELIIGPDEDYMTSAEKQRYIELAEKKCEQYMALTTVRVEAIPLVPSPSPVVVNVSSCARSVPLVVGGNVVTIQQFPHMALLGWTKVQSGGYSWKCGGSLVSERHVLTAAHCAYQERDDSVSTGPPRVVQLGSSRLDDPGAIVQRVSSVTRHPRYRPPQSYHDIAVVTMTTAVTFSSAIRPACMGVPPAPGEHFIATGWGKTEFGGEQSSQLRGVSLSVWSRTDCGAALGNTRKLPRGPDGSQTCAGERDGGKDTCQGDSGGPAQVSWRCAWRVLAVTSAGRACGAAGTPALYANVPMAFVAKVAFGRVDRDEQPHNRQNTNTNRRQNDFDQQNSDRQQSGFNHQNSNGNSYDNPNSNNRQNVYNHLNSNRRQSDYNEPNSYNRDNDYNEENTYNRENEYNRQPNKNNRENDYNQEKRYNQDNEYNRQPSSNNRENDYNQENRYNQDNEYNRQPSSNNRENDYNRENRYNQDNEYNRQPSSNNRENNYNQENRYNRENNYNQQPNSNNRENEYKQEDRYNHQNSNSQQNSYNNQNRNTNNRQNQSSKRSTNTPRWSENQQSYNDRRNNNYNNPPYVENTDARRGATDEYTASRPHYYYPSLDPAYSDGRVWRT